MTLHYDDDEHESGEGLMPIPEGKEAPLSPNAMMSEAKAAGAALADLANKTSAELKMPKSPGRSGKKSGGQLWLTHSEEYTQQLSLMTDSYSSLGGKAQLLNCRLFQTLITGVKGPSLQLLLALKGDSQRYTYGIIVLWKHAELWASNYCTAAMSAMQAVKFQGDARQWKMQVMAASCEIYAFGVTIEHFMMGCLLSSFQGKSPQVQSMMVNDINSDKVGPGMQLEELISNYSMIIATMNSIDGPSCGINNAGLNRDCKKGGDAKFKGKCNNCGKTGHKLKDCRTDCKKTAPVGQVQQKGTVNKKDWCKYCMKGPHKEEDCYTKKNGNPPHLDSKCMPAKASCYCCPIHRAMHHQRSLSRTVIKSVQRSGEWH